MTIQTLLNAELTITEFEFLSCLLGTFDNKHQAFTNPTGFAHINISYKLIDNGIEHKSWYQYQGSDKPYRVNFHRVKEVSSNQIMMMCYNSNWEHRSGCDVLFTKQGSYWVGKLQGECIVRGARLDSHVRLTRDRYECYDAGRNQQGKIVWGGTDVYIFKRTGD